tara:strand:- start:4393 stop:5274 length:882 start_codon:yes stop_codon:yes gene_type:complete
MANITDTLKEQFKDLLTDESFNEIEKVFNEAVEQRAALTTKSALVKQDEDHAGKVHTLLEAIDDDHTKKLDRIVEAVTENHTAKLRAIILKYEGELQGDATLYKESLINNISNYLDLYIEKTYPQDMLEEAVKNKKFEQLVTEMRNVLGVDMALAKESIKDAILDGKLQISETTSKLEEASKENVNLKQELNHAQRELTLDNLTKDLPEIKKNYVQKVLGNKDVEFINENFQYTLDLFDKDTETELETLTEEAKNDVQGTVDPVVQEEVVTEQNNNDDDPAMWSGYMNELGKY